MAAPGKKFSFMRLVNNAVPNFARDDPNDVDLKPAQADALVRLQLTQASPAHLIDSAFFVAGITDSESVSKKVHKALEKSGIISSDASTPAITTSMIGKNFANQLAAISVHAQRKLVGMLFFWEEECTRWKLLEAERGEIIRTMDQNRGDSSDLQVALNAVEMKRRLLPSERGEPTANVGEGAGNQLPAYSSSS